MEEETEKSLCDIVSIVFSKETFEKNQKIFLTMIEQKVKELKEKYGHKEHRISMTQSSWTIESVHQDVYTRLTALIYLI